MTRSGVASSLAERAAALRAREPGPPRNEIDALLTDCAAALLALRAEIRRIDRRLRSTAQTVARGFEALDEARRLAERNDELEAERSGLAALIAELRARRDGLDRQNGLGSGIAPPTAG